MPTHILRNDRPKGGLTQVGKRHLESRALVRAHASYRRGWTT